MDGRDLAPSTIDRRLSTVCGYYRLAHIDGRIPSNPAQDAAGRPPTRGERLGLGALYAICGAFILIGGWVWGGLLDMNDSNLCDGRSLCDSWGANGLLWPVTVVASVAILLVLFPTRPVRRRHHFVWAVVAGLSFFGAYRAAGWFLAIVAAAVATTIAGFGRRRGWTWI